MTTERPTGSGGTESQSEVRDELKRDAGRLKDTAQSRAKEEADTRKGQAAQVAGSASSALNTAADDLQNNPDAPDWMASALQKAAHKIDGMANHIENRSIDDLGQEVAQFARQSPGAFLAASAAAGFAAARVLRAGMDKKHHDGDSRQRGQNWPADENIKPTTSGGQFTPAYTTAETGGVAR